MNKKYNLEERTTIFGEDVIDYCKKIKVNVINSSIINQLVRSATSIGANYFEANGASSKKDFRNKIFICKKETKETSFWLKMLIKSQNEINNDYKKLVQEAHELTLIFSKIAASSGN